MLRYLLRRLGYGILVLLGVNLLTFVLFFAVNTPDDMARLAIGGQRVSADAIEQWKRQQGYDKPLFVNHSQTGLHIVKDTIFFERSVPLLRLDFGFSDGGHDIGHEIANRMGPSLAFSDTYFYLGLGCFCCFCFVSCVL